MLSLRLKNSHTVRSLLLCFFALMNGYLHTSTLSIVKGTGEPGYSPIAIFTFGFVYAVVALFALIAPAPDGALPAAGRACGRKRESSSSFPLPSLLSAH